MERQYHRDASTLTHLDKRTGRRWENLYMKIE